MFEFYGEYRRSDHNIDCRDAVVQYDHTRAYTLGLRKFIAVDRFGAETLNWR